jgi:DNA-binding MarR family transcriptional regulator
MTAKPPTRKRPSRQPVRKPAKQIVKRETKQEIAADAWRRMFSFFINTRAQRNRALEKFNLTPNDARALHSLDAEEGRPMSALAEEWGCDASNATGMVDRLEKQGLAERRTVATDRRVKLVVLTVLGLKTRTAFRQELYEPPPELLALSRAELEVFRDAMAQLPQA